MRLALLPHLLSKMNTPSIEQPSTSEHIHAMLSDYISLATLDCQLFELKYRQDNCGTVFSLRGSASDDHLVTRPRRRETLTVGAARFRLPPGMPAALEQRERAGIHRLETRIAMRNMGLIKWTEMVDVRSSSIKYKLLTDRPGSAGMPHH